MDSIPPYYIVAVYQYIELYPQYRDTVSCHYTALVGIAYLHTPPYTVAAHQQRSKQVHLEVC